MLKIFSRFSWGCAALGAALGLGLGGHPAHAAEFRIGNVQVDQSPLGRGVLRFAEEVQRKSGGRLTPVPLNGGKAGSDTEMRQKTVDGSLEMMIATSALFTTLANEIAIWDTPFLFANYKEADAVLDSAAGRRVLQALDAKGLVALGYWENGFRNVTNGVRPIVRLEDFQGIKLRVQQSEVFINMFNALGAEARPMAWPEVYNALKAKTIDAQENPLPTILSAKLYEVQPYLVLTRHLYAPTLVVASKKWWNTLSPADQKLVQDTVMEVRLSQREDSRRATEAALVELQAKGMKVSELAAGERVRIERKLERVIAQVARHVGLPLWIEVNNELSKTRAGQ